MLVTASYFKRVKVILT